MVMTGMLNGRGKVDNRSKVDTDANAIRAAKMGEREKDGDQKNLWRV